MQGERKSVYFRNVLRTNILNDGYHGRYLTEGQAICTKHFLTDTRTFLCVDYVIYFRKFFKTACMTNTCSIYYLVENEMKEMNIYLHWMSSLDQLHE